jgi:hypothetical protein
MGGAASLLAPRPLAAAAKPWLHGKGDRFRKHSRRASTASAVRRPESGYPSDGFGRCLSSSSSGLPIQATQPGQLANATAGRDRFDIAQVVNKVEVHPRAILASCEATSVDGPARRSGLAVDHRRLDRAVPSMKSPSQRNRKHAKLLERLETVEGIERGLADVIAGRTRPARQVFSRLRRKYRIARQARTHESQPGHYRNVMSPTSTFRPQGSAVHAPNLIGPFGHSCQTKQLWQEWGQTTASAYEVF